MNDSADSEGAQPVLTFDQVIAAVEAAGGLTNGVRTNIVSAIRRAASLMPGAAGTTAIVNIQALARRLDRVTPAKLGFRHKGSLSAFRSNLQRGLQLAGYTVMPGRHTTKLMPAWAASLASIENEKLRRSLSRLAHVASGDNKLPTAIDDAYVDKFRRRVETTCLKSKSNKVVRSTVKAWNSAGLMVPGWPATRLNTGQSDGWYYSLPWSAFPPSFRADVNAYSARGQEATDFLGFLDDEPADQLAFLEPRTQENYRDGLKRAASILVKRGVPAESIVGIGSLVSPERVRTILEFLSKRLQRKDGGLLGLVAMLLYVAARDWVYPKVEAKSPEAAVIAKLQHYFTLTKLKTPGMSERTRARLGAFDDPRVLTEYLQLPRRLVAEAEKLPVNSKSAALIRLALFISIGLDTLLRPGNIVSLNMKDHLQPVSKGTKREVFVRIPKTKNGMAFTGKLRPRTVDMFELYRPTFRQVHAGGYATEWLFPGSANEHWREERAYEAVNDYCAKHLGIDMTPHLHRALGGKIILSANPGALFEVQQALLHKRLTTTRGFYVAYETSATQERYHDLLSRHDTARRERS